MWPVNYITRFRRLKAHVGQPEWPRHVLRHSFVSYHLVLHKDAAAAAAHELGLKLI